MIAGANPIERILGPQRPKGTAVIPVGLCLGYDTCLYKSSGSRRILVDLELIAIGQICYDARFAQDIGRKKFCILLREYAHVQTLWRRLESFTTMLWFALLSIDTSGAASSREGV